ncbi:beta-ketoacyl-ACP synthase [Agrobacterium vitis]|uniref:beta-ketoacyl-ACP synthase n=1 Tax=Rhizobium/Agrobacterium group TaxID=227290 RepID=UPI0012E832B9|nr:MULTISPECIES: beta-ketoacyl-ACP synthase [Rhizobium/Agrobacterium group]MCF1448621.1 beta-ketoacyl-ACP synthase [Allorhizobium ampelinum]MVA70007.1 beta-ketoacyl-ACP synthase [Agrobacterium vitis]
MHKTPNDVVITGIGIVSCHGTGKEPHLALLSAGTAAVPPVEVEKFAPYPIHPMPQIDWSTQIAKRGDQRQMENWQRLGVYAAGLALDDAGLKDDVQACATMDMIVAAGGGERDINVDTLIVNEGLKRNDRAQLVNEKLTTELRPTLFLAQLSNLMAGNISIVHKVTGSSRTFMGEEAAGISAIETAFARIRAGQSTHSLVGGAFVADRDDIFLLVEGIQAHTTGPWKPLWQRQSGEGGGMILGTVGAFLVLEQRAYAEARGAHIYAVLDAIEGDRGQRANGGLEKRLNRMAGSVGKDIGADALVLSGASGMHEISAREKTALEKAFPGAAIRGFGGITGHGLEAQFPLGLALAALALDGETIVPAFDPTGEAAMTKPARQAIVTTVGYVRGEGMAHLSAEA